MRIVRLKLDRYLNAHGITRYRLAEDSRVRYTTVNQYYKNAVKRYDSDILARFCNALNCDVTELIECVEESKIMDKS